MALDADLVVDRVADLGIQKLNGDFAPFNAFALEALENTTRLGRNTVQVEVSGTLPTPYDNSADYQAGSGTNTNAAVTITEISAQQTITSQEQLQGHRFRTMVSSLSETIKDAAWDDVTPTLTVAKFGEYSGGATIEASFTVAIAQAMHEEVTGGGGVHLLIKRGTASAVLLADNRDSFSLSAEGGYGYAGIHRVKDFTGGEANNYAVALNPEKAVVMVNGAPDRLEQVNRAVLGSEIVTLDNGIRVEIQTWVDTQTKALWVGMATVIGFKEVDSNAAILINSA